MAAWNDLTGGPGPCWDGVTAGFYSDVAASAILSTALGLWSDTAAALGDDGDGLDTTADAGTE